MLYENENEAQVSTDAFEQNPVLVQYQTEGEQENWVKELDASRKERKDFNEIGNKVIARYANDKGETEKGRKYFNIFFANTEIKQSALYARTPTPDIKRRFNDPDDDQSRVAANLLQRNIVYELDCDGFDDKFEHMLFDRLAPGIGVGWVRLEQEEQEQPQPAAIDPMTGQAVEQPPVTVITHQNAEIDYVPWDKFLWSPCRTWFECRWVARVVPMTKEAIKARFGSTALAEVLRDLPFNAKNAGDESPTDKLGPKNIVEKTVDVVEVWDKERKLVLWIVESAKVPLDVAADDNEFPGFFPTPLPPLARVSTSNTTPISDYKEVQDQYVELDNLNARASALIEALKLRWVYDSANPALRDLYTTVGELEGVPVKDWMVQVSEKGGLKGAIEFAPLAEIADTYTKLVAAREQVKAQIYEIEGISDIMRGAATPYESATGAEAKASYSSVRLSVLQEDVAKYAQALLRLKAHLICKFYEPQFILQRAGTLPTVDQQFIGPAIQLLKSEQMRHFRLNVSVDSIQSPNWIQEKNERTAVVNAIAGFIGQFMPALQQQPDMAPLGMHLLKFLVAGFKGARDIEGYVDQALEAMLRAQQDKQKQPPKPTPQELEQQAKQAELQTQMQVAQVKAQADVQVATIQAQAKDAAARTQAEVDALKAQLRAQMDRIELEIKTVKNQTDAVLRKAELQIDATRAAHENAVDLVEMGTV